MAAFFPATQQPAGSTRRLLRQSDGSEVTRTILASGLRVLSETVPGARSVTLGVWAPVGSRDETRAGTGAAHFLEHLLFKGTATRSVLDVSSQIDAVGGQINAFTTKEYTCFHAKVLGEDLGVAVDVLLDITTRPALRATDIEAERSVILEEIAMNDDDPADRAGEGAESAALAGSPLARPILGSRTSITGMSRRTLHGFFTTHYQPQRLTVVAAGNVDHDALVALVAAATDPLAWPDAIPAVTHRGGDGASAPAPRPSRVLRRQWSGEQCNLAIALPGLPRTHPARRALEVLNTIIGGGMSSRLFQAIREDRGLAYSVYSDHTAYSDAGVLSIAAGCQPERAGEVCDVIRTELAAVVRAGVTDEEIARAKGYLCGSIALSNEDTSARMIVLGRAEAVTGRLVEVDEALAQVHAVTRADLTALAEQLLTAPRQVCAVGAAGDARTRRALTAVAEGASR